MSKQKHPAKSGNKHCPFEHPPHTTMYYHSGRAGKLKHGGWARCCYDPKKSKRYIGDDGKYMGWLCEKHAFKLGVVW